MSEVITSLISLYLAEKDNVRRGTTRIIIEVRPTTARAAHINHVRRGGERRRGRSLVVNRRLKAYGSLIDYGRLINHRNLVSHRGLINNRRCRCRFVVGFILSSHRNGRQSCPKNTQYGFHNYPLPF